MPRTIANFDGLLRKSESVEECLRHFLAAVRPYNIDTLAAGEIDLDEPHIVVFFALAWPPEWRKFYQTQRMHEYDPIVESLGYYTSPYTWSDMRGDKRFGALTREALDKCARHGWTEGLVVPLTRSGRRYGLVSLVASGGAFDEDAKGLLSVMSIAFHQRVRALAPISGFPVPPAGLTDRERDCLNLIARGLSDREVGEKLGIRESTARSYFEGARSKLKAKSRPETIAKAMSWGILAA